MKLSKKLVSVSMFLLILLFLSSCGIIPQTPEGKISGRVLIPLFEMSKDVSGWIPTANAVVTIVDASGVTHTTTTDEEGYYNFEDITVNPNTVITASVTVDENIVILKNVIPHAVTAGEDYNAGEMTPESTALALVVEELLAEGMDPEDIDHEEIESNDNFSDLVEKITEVLEEGGDVTTDPDIVDIINDIINPPVPPFATITFSNYKITDL